MSSRPSSEEKGDVHLLQAKLESLRVGDLLPARPIIMANSDEIVQDVLKVSVVYIPPEPLVKLINIA